MLAAVQHAEALLRASEAKGRSLSFAFVVPTWEQLPFHLQLLRSAWRRGEPLLIEADGHGYLDGAQHEKRPEERSRASSFGSTVAVLQTSAASLRWPVTAELNARLSSAFAASLPSAAAAAERQKRGGGDAVAKLLDRREGAIVDNAKGEATTGERLEPRAEQQQPLAAARATSKKKRPRPDP